MSRYITASGTRANPYRSSIQSAETPRTAARAISEKMYRSTRATIPARSAGMICRSIRSQKSVA